MNEKENALRIIRFDRPERIVEGPPIHDISYFGVNHESRENLRGHDVPVGTRWRDIWGVGWCKEMDGVMAFPVEHPLAGLNLDKFSWPNPDDERLVGQIRKKAASAERANNFLFGSHRETLWERSYNLVGMDRLMLAFYEEPDAVRELFHRVMDFQLGIARHYLDAGIEMAGTGDDLGTQIGLLFSPDILRDLFISEYRRLFSLYKENGVLINHHSCGHVEPILDVFMELGVDILNPVQATANDLAYMRRITMGKMAMLGGVSSGTIVSGPPERIVGEARNAMWMLGRKGGYFCAPDQSMPFPSQHLKVLHDTVETYGTYPLRLPEDV